MQKMIAKEPSLCNHSGPNTLKPHLYLGVSEWIGPHTDLTNPTDFFGSTSQQVNKSMSQQVNKSTSLQVNKSMSGFPHTDFLKARITQITRIEFLFQLTNIAKYRKSLLEVYRYLFNIYKS